MRVQEISSGIYETQGGRKKQIATRNLVPGNTVYGERTLEDDSVEYRIWNPRRSKLGAMAVRKFQMPFSKDSRVLYLGAASGTTVSHVSDMVPEGVVYAVEFAPSTMRQLLRLCDARKNIVPLLADATRPVSYAHVVEPVDVIFQDVAQANQAEIAVENAKQFLKKDGYLLLSIKARSVDSTVAPEKIFKEQLKILSAAQGIKLKIVKKQNLSPFHIDHMGVVAQRID
ncbi:fibrillarin-like pre-rRNA processing protein [Methanohalophilus levihalophilus]|uniref:fibrillarin-like rRNA/tRNA 2'-O-methyltransferase n=1 Tax=Methanohalophilus levihalophilus TaxID=1431282 RepID=UPI001AE8CE27|nr:fibrillarin-like rRNA/tRNA 2'-O-methyltransferase [Methanohalophilus levihalophilus]MBP2030007.1 fibrillarin-like pre-rRNA processing protein [Methanohalophilus levihalophilus]